MNRRTQRSQRKTPNKIQLSLRPWGSWFLTHDPTDLIEVKKVNPAPATRRNVALLFKPLILRCWIEEFEQEHAKAAEEDLKHIQSCLPGIPGVPDFWRTNVSTDLIQAEK